MWIKSPTGFAASGIQFIQRLNIMLDTFGLSVEARDVKTVSGAKPVPPKHAPLVTCSCAADE